MSTTSTVITTTKHPTPSSSLTVLQATSCEDGGEYASKRARSRMGCFTCRKRKKRCDEVRPMCGACARLKLDCQYPAPGTERKNKKRRKSDAAEDDTEDLVNAEDATTLSSEIPTIAEEPEPELTLDVVPFEDVIPFDSIDLDLLLNDRELGDDDNKGGSNIKQPEFILTLPQQIQQVWSGVSLDITGSQLFDYFKSRLARIICVSSDDSNSFLKIFVPMATQDTAVLYSLVAWAGFHMGKGQLQDYALEYLDKAIQNVRHDGSTTSLASMLLICAAEICSGDVMHWDKHLTSAADMIKKAGGLASFAEDNTLRWLASNFAYHDILASSTCSRRTHFGSDEYDQIMRHGFGLDSLIGCCQPLFKILSEISELAVDAQKALEVEQLRSIKARAKELEEKITVCHPDPMDMICLDRQELEQQLTLFEIFQLTAHLHLRQAVLRTNSASIEMQCIWHDLLASIDVVMGTRVEGGLVFPLFIAGINCTRQDMRQLMCIRIERYYERNLARNIRRARHLMEEVWSRDECGTKHVDWYKIIQTRGWDICFA